MPDILRLSPRTCTFPDDKGENIIVEVVLPGVEKKNISFKISDNGFYVKATKLGVEYAGSYAFCCPVEPEKASSNYSNGVLEVKVPYKQTYKQPLERLEDIKVE